MAIYDLANGGWFQVGGTSEACPTWAGYIAIADQGRALAGGAPLTGYTQTLPALYSLPYTDFNDTTVGNDSATNKLFDQYLYGVNATNAPAKPGYDTVTGLGSPKANLLVPDLAAYGLATNLAVTTQPPATVISGDGFGLTVTVEDSFGQVDSNFNGTVTLSLSSNPGGVTFNPVSVAAVDGVAVFSSLSVNTVDPGYQFQASATVNGSLSTTSSSTFAVTTNPTLTSGSFYPATSDASLRAAIASTNTNSFASNTIYLEAGTYTLTNVAIGRMIIQDLSSSQGSKTLTIIGQGPNQTVIEPSTSKGFADRIFEIISQAGASMTVIFKDLTIAGGYAANGGNIGGKASLGGGLLIDGGTVSMTNVNFVGNKAQGNLGTVGGTGKPNQPGGAGGAGGAARGGAFYMAAGNLSLNNTVFKQNIAWGGKGGSGGMGGSGFQTGGNGGLGGSASGGAGYVAGGTVTGSSNRFQSNAVLGGRGGSGGMGGTGASSSPGGRGGAGAAGGSGFGAGLFVFSGSVNLGASKYQGGLALGGAGGIGGVQGVTNALTSKVTNVILGLSGPGAGGNGADAAGGGVYLYSGTLNLNGGDAGSNLAKGGAFGYSGNLGFYYFGFTSAVAGGTSGHSDGGGIFVNSGSLTMGNMTLSLNVADYGGALGISKAGSVKATSVQISANVANYGGGVLNYGTFALNAGDIGGNSAAFAGGIYNAKKATVDLTSAGIFNNKAYSGSGGGIENLSGTVKIVSCTISGNTAFTRGGGIYTNQGVLTITGVNEVTSNTVQATGTGSSVTVGFGGGIEIEAGTATITGATVSSNNSEFGGGIFIFNGSVTISNDTISGNGALIGGGIHNGVHNTGTVLISNAMITGNTAGNIGGGINNRGPLTITGSTISGNVAGNDGGGIYNIGTISIDSLQLTSNTAGLEGGGIYNAGSVAVASSTLSLNVASGGLVGSSFSPGRGGGILNTSTLSLVNVTLTQNTAGFGGGLFNSGGKVNATGITFSSNDARTGDGGGIYFHNGTLTFKQGRLVGNQAAGSSVNPSYGRGGGMYQAGGRITIAGSTSSPSKTSGPGSIVDNSAVQGGGIYLSGGSLTLSLTHLANNTATNSGGAIANGGTLVLANSVVFQNTAGVDGGAILNSSNLSILTINSSTLTNNSAGGEGGALRNLGPATATITSSTIEKSSAALGGAIANSGKLTISGSTIFDDSASQLGGGVYDDVSGLVTLTNSTIAENTSQAGGGIYTQGTLKSINVTIAENLISGSTGAGLDVSSGAASLYNTIVASNTPAGTDLAGVLTVNAHNLIGVPNAELGPLTNNGGPTLTIGLLQGSPAIDGGANTFNGVTVPTTDQRGALRGGQSNSINAGAVVDIGAYEASSSFLITSAADSYKTAGTLRVGLIWAAESINFNPENLAPSPTANAPNTLVFATTGVFSSPQTITLTLGSLTIPTTSQGVAIEGPGGGLVTISGGGAIQVIDVPTGATATLEGINITDGKARLGGGIGNLGTLTLININLEGNSAVSEGGGVYSVGTIKGITGGTISNNSASFGGGVFSVGSLNLTDATVKNNTASNNGGGVAYSASSHGSGSLVMTGTTFSGNSANEGGGLFVGSGAVTISGSTLTGNSATFADGGAMYVFGGTLAITGATFSSNTALNGSGGAIYNAGGGADRE